MANAQTQLDDSMNPDGEHFGGWSRFLCVMGGIVSIGGGISLATLRAASENNLFAAIANGIGWYCIGKGIFMIAAPFQAKGAVLHLLHRAALGTTPRGADAVPVGVTRTPSGPASDVSALVKELEERGYSVRQSGSDAWEITSHVGTSFAHGAAGLKRAAEMLPVRGTAPTNSGSGGAV